MIKTKCYKASQIAKIVGGELIGEDCLIEYVSFDSRETMVNGTVFWTLKGERYDSESFADEAIKNGADAIISSAKKHSCTSVILVDDTKRALYDLASHNKGKTEIIGVTGSVGKTTIKQLIHSVLAQQFKASATPENNNNEIGAAQTLLSITNEEYCVIEMGMRGKGEIDFLAGLCKPTISVIGNVGTAHLERLGSKEAIFDAKCEIIPHTKSYAVVPNEWRFKGLNYGTIEPYFVGQGGNAYAENISYTENGISFDIFDKNEKEIIRAHVHSIYEHDAYNCVFAYVVGRLCGVTTKNIIQGILEFKNCKNRGEIIKIGKISIINDCYNSSPEGVKGAIQGLVKACASKQKRAVAILGDMLEIGENSGKIHQEIGKFSRKIGVFDVVSMGEFAGDICRGFGGGKAFESYQEIVSYIAENFDKNDMLLVKASRGMHFEKIIEGLKEKINEN